MLGALEVFMISQSIIWTVHKAKPSENGTVQLIYYSKEVKGQRKCFYHFCKYVFTCVNIIFFFGGGVHYFFHQGNKLVSNQKFFVCFLFVSHQIIILSFVATSLAR